jgi:hypothetical protein
MADDSAARAGELEALARRRFGNLSEAEERLLQAAPKGEVAYCVSNPKDKEPTEEPADTAKRPDSDPGKAGVWGSGREIRAELIRWLCVDQSASKKVDPRGARVHGAKITGKLDLSYASIAFPLRLTWCRLAADAELRFVRIPAIDLRGSSTGSLDLSESEVRVGVFLSSGFSADGEVRLLGTRIGSLDCSGGTFRKPGGVALDADRAEVRESIFLEDRFSAIGEVRLVAAQIGGGLSCKGASFKNPGKGAIRADRARVAGSVFFNAGFLADGEVSLPGARIGSNLECSRGAFKNPGGTALHFDSVDVKGDVSLDDGFSAEGEVQLFGSQIGGDLICRGANFKNPGGDALSADGTEVKGAVFLRDGFSSEGTVRLVGAQMAALECDGGKFGGLNLGRAVVKGAFFWHNMRDGGNTQLDLTNASVGAIADDEPSWPKWGNLFLDGFVYERISVGPTDASARLRWLDRQKEFKPQPYRQLAKVLRDGGDDVGAKQVLLKLEDLARTEDRKRLVHSPIRWLVRSGEDVVSDATVGYGIYPGRAIWYLCGLTALGWIVHRRARRLGAMAPTDKDAYTEFHKGQTPVHYQPFNPLVYSVENCIPLVKLGQDERWQPDPNPQRRVPPVAAGKVRRAVDSVLDFLVRDWVVTPGALRWFRWIMIGLGWLLATFFVAGLTGIIKVG